MSELFKDYIIVSILAATLRIATPLLLASLGELLSERVGILNLGVEGTMLLGAFAAYFTAWATGSAWAGVVGGMAAGMLMNIFFALLAATIKVEQMVAGLAANFFGAGLSLFLYKAAFDSAGGVPPSIEPLEEWAIPGLSDLPYVGDVLFNQHVLTYAAVLLVPVIWYVLYRTRLGLEMRSLGENPKVLDSAGLSVQLRQYIALAAGGALIGAAGAFLTVVSTVRFVPDITAGRGWLALVIVIAGNWRPLGILMASLVFAFIDALQLQIQGVGIHVSYALLLGLPYAVAIVLMVLKRDASQEPAKLGIPYFRGTR